MHSLSVLIYLLSFLFIVSCGQRSMGDGKTISSIQIPKQDGSYEIVFESLNESIAGDFLGEGELILKNNKLTLKIDIMESPVEAVHYQHLYAHERCPDLRDDLNDDGLVDEYEINKKMGLPLFPLDGDLSSHTRGQEIVPKSDKSGQYNYQASVSLFSLYKDLLMPDLNPQDGFRKLKTLMDFTFKRSIILIYGINSATYLPGSVQSYGVLGDREAFPIACGQFIKNSR